MYFTVTKHIYLVPDSQGHRKKTILSSACSPNSLYKITKHDLPFYHTVDLFG